MLNKPLLLAMMAAAIVAASGVSNATLWDIDSGLISPPPPQTTWLNEVDFQHSTADDLGRERWKRALAWANEPLQWQPASYTNGAADTAEATASEAQIANILLLAFGIIGLIGFWRKISR
jgi:hypothetical protein